MPRVAAASVGFHPVSSFEEFADHMRAVLDRTPTADLIVLPEFVTLELLTIEDNWRDMTLSDIPRLAEHTDAYVDLFAREAASRGQYILAGTHPVASGAKVKNTAHLFGPEGLILTHAKTHLFRAEGDLGLIEKGTASPPVVELPFGRVGLNICYEVQIPECTDATIAEGAQILLVPSMTLSEAGSWRVIRCAQARAIENQIFVVSSQLFGTPEGFFPGCYARSGVFSPCDSPWPSNGELATTPANVESSAEAEIALADLDTVRETGATATYDDRGRNAHLYRTWPNRH